MPDLGPHAAFIVAAYSVTFLAVATLAYLIIDDDRQQRRLIAEMQKLGLTRRSAQAAAPRTKRKSRS